MRDAAGDISTLQNQVVARTREEDGAVGYAGDVADQRQQRRAGSVRVVPEGIGIYSKV